jgi:integrase
MRDYGTGSKYLRGTTWWIAFYVDGKIQRESTKTADEGKAEKILRGRLKEVHAHELDFSKPFLAQRDRKKTIADLLDALKADFKIRGIDSPQNLSNIKRAREDFGSFRALCLSSDDIDGYVTERLNDGSAKASINRVLQLVKQSYVFAKLPAPEIRKLDERGNVRSGFFSNDEIRKVIANLPADLSDFVLFAWLTGMRKNEIASLRWEDVDNGAIRLRAENAKSGTSRLIPFEGELAELMKRRKAARKVEIKNCPVTMSALIFHREGEPIREFRKSWARACCKAGVGQMVCPNCELAVDEKRHCAKCGANWQQETLKYSGRIFHDLRRSAVRNMVAAGVPQTVAMKVSGHKTDAMFRRYAIVSETDLRTALRASQAYAAAQKDNVVEMAAGK